MKCILFSLLAVVSAFGVSGNDVAKQDVAERPRLILPAKGWAKIESRIETSERHRAWYRDVKQNADALLEAEIKIGRNTQSDLMALALVYKLEGGENGTERLI